MSADDEADGVISDEWRKEGTCGACRHFMSDYGEPPTLYGHCKMYRRTGSRGSADYACDEFAPLPGFDKTVQLLDTGPVRGEGKRPTRPGPSGRATRRSSPARRISGPRIVRRRRDGNGAELERATELMNDDVIAALTGDGSGGPMDRETLRDVLLDVIESFIAIEDCELGSKWNGGTVMIHPADPDLKPHEIPVENLFKKVVMIRDRLRVLEQKINSNSALSVTDKAQLQQYISGCYGSLTTFNVLFKHKEDKFSSK